MSSVVKPTNYPSLKNAPLVGLAEGNGAFNNYHMTAAILTVPYLLKTFLPLFNRGGFKTYLFLLAVSGVPTTVAYWIFISNYGARVNEKVALPGKDLEEYIIIKDLELKKLYNGKEKIPMQVFQEAYFDQKIDFKGDVLDIMEARHDWARFNFNIELFKYIFTVFFPDVISHSRGMDEEQIRDTYDRGNDFYEWFLGPRMIYTGGVITKPDEEETLEQLQDNKLALVCHKIDLKPGDKMLDIGCGWGTLATYAAKNFDCDVTGVTLAKEQARFGQERLAKNGCDPEKARILCMDYREIPAPPGTFNKITALEMAEHVGVRRYSAFLKQIYTMLADDGYFYLQVAGLRQCWQFEDLVWGLFMNKYIFPGADASCALGWVINKCEAAGFEVKSVDVLGVHYSTTLWFWYKNWLKNEDKVLAKYGERWFRIWAFFLAWSVIIARQGSSSVFQITLHKNLNAYHRADGIKSHSSIHFTPAKEPLLVE